MQTELQSVPLWVSKGDSDKQWQMNESYKIKYALQTKYTVSQKNAPPSCDDNFVKS